MIGRSQTLLVGVIAAAFGAGLGLLLSNMGLLLSIVGPALIYPLGVAIFAIGGILSIVLLIVTMYIISIPALLILLHTDESLIRRRKERGLSVSDQLKKCHFGHVIMANLTYVMIVTSCLVIGAIFAEILEGLNILQHDLEFHEHIEYLFGRKNL